MAGKCCKGFRASSRGGVGYYDVPLEKDSAEGLLLAYKGLGFRV
jgi:hypothetical protein